MLAGAAGLLPLPLFPAAAQHTVSEQIAPDYRAAALFLPTIINDNYAYLERLPGGRYVLTPELLQEAQAVRTERDLLRFAERALFLLADHHAHTTSSFADSWALVPSYTDLWVEKRNGRYIITAVREGSPAARASIVEESILEQVDATPIDQAVDAFWRNKGATRTEERDAFAARVLVAGRRDRDRLIMVREPAGARREVALPNLYKNEREAAPPVTAVQSNGALRITINNALGDNATIAAFDAAMTQAEPGQRIVIDLTDTPSGGNTAIARAIMGWFADRPTAYQMHAYPAEERQTGIARQRMELVLPRAGRHHDGPVEVQVGRWTGSMGEGLAIGLRELGAKVCGDRMAGLLGAINNFRLGESTIQVKLPFERLSSVDGRPRADFIPQKRCGLR